MSGELELGRGGEIGSDVLRESCWGNVAGNLGITRGPDVVRDYDFRVDVFFLMMLSSPGTCREKVDTGLHPDRCHPIRILPTGS